MFNNQLLLKSVKYSNRDYFTNSSFNTLQRALFTITHGRMISLAGSYNKLFLESFNRILRENKIILFIENTFHKDSLYAIELIKFYRIEFDIVDLSETRIIKSIIETQLNSKKFPQLYIDGEVLGNLENLQFWHENGSLYNILSKKGLIKNMLKI